MGARTRHLFRQFVGALFEHVGGWDVCLSYTFWRLWVCNFESNYWQFAGWLSYDKEAYGDQEHTHYRIWETRRFYDNLRFLNSVVPCATYRLFDNISHDFLISCQDSQSPVYECLMLDACCLTPNACLLLAAWCLNTGLSYPQREAPAHPQRKGGLRPPALCETLCGWVWPVRKHLASISKHHIASIKHQQPELRDWALRLWQEIEKALFSQTPSFFWENVFSDEGGVYSCHKPSKPQQIKCTSFCKVDNLLTQYRFDDVGGVV